MRRNAGAGSPWGFALPMAILALVAVGLVLTAGIHLVLRPGLAPVRPEQATEAFYLAETGLNTVVAEWRPPAEAPGIWGPPEFHRGATSQGEWEAEVRRVGEEAFFIRATGVAATERGRTSARRSIGVAARIEPLAPWVSRGFQHDGAVELLSGSRIEDEDMDPPSWNGELCAFGSEGTSTPDRDELEPIPWEDLTRLADIRWDGGLIEGIGPVAGPGGCDRAEASNWGDPLHPEAECGSLFPVIHVAGDAVVRGSGSGQGTLVVDGDLTIEDGFEFHGTVLVRGTLTLQGGPEGSPTIYGGVRVENPAGEVLHFSGTSRVLYSRCAIGRAMLGNDRLRRIRPIPTRGWVDLAGASL